MPLYDRTRNEGQHKTSQCIIIVVHDLSEAESLHDAMLSGVQPMNVKHIGQERSAGPALTSRQRK